MRCALASAAVAASLLFAGSTAIAAPQNRPTATAEAVRTVGPDDVCGFTKSRPALQRGSSGPAVQQAQCYLNFAIDAGLDEDGDFGRLTETATTQFQRCARIVVDGRIGAQTWSFLSFWANSPGAPFAC
ncbi:peptidoglycan-binding domain-containing protein [Streptomyces sp. S.PNR 29]|uniref:peptidoglycan-binding domain-containing protein n=1 Tax=Streptomyces sp. S.PNR 29 TaxID=2973805 RepID=UPI0025B19189|nr:peptidoglycan-binding domain-containing protein [Streptomyces sp. S.PNR 29]MDN0194618.1 peptidoglycan-binding protein [Streptomyces sp. S.PNR 29]